MRRKPICPFTNVSSSRAATRARMLWFTGLMDNICPPSSQFAAYNKLTCEKNIVLYPDFGHENLPYSGDRAMQFMLDM